MVISNALTHPLSLSRTAGALYLSIAVFGGFSIGYVPSVILVDGDATVSATNLAENFGLFRAGVFGDIAVLMLEVAISVVLYALFRPVNHVISLVALVSRAAMILVMSFNLVLTILPAVLLDQAGHLSAFNQTQLETLGLLFTKAHTLGVYVWQLFFGMHLIALGWLAHKSGAVPKILSLGIFVGAFGYILQGVVELLFFDHQILTALIIGLLTIVTIAEISFGLWLLFRGIRTTL